MIQRFCFVKLFNDEVEGRADIAARLAAELREAGADAVVGVPADESAKSWDLSLVIAAASLDAWHALSLVPAVARALDDLAGRAAVVKAWTFDTVC
ncbi:MAG TPA: hypothetical protein VIX73_00140 [Kofleriaceae bacterium]